jgi:hypothetical protein
MTVERNKAIGFSVRVELAWLEQAAALVSLGRSPEDVRASLQAIIGDARTNASEKRGDSRTRTTNVISRMWVEPPDSVVDFRNRGLDLLGGLPTTEHVALHWGMAMAAYPFFATVVSVVGRLLRLQDALMARDVHRRVAEEYGDRPTVVRATGVTLGNCVSWGLLASDAQRKHYRLADRREVGPDVALLLLQAVLHASDAESAPLDALLRSPALFPFELPRLTAHDIDQCPGLCAMSLGGSEATVSLAQ